MTEAADLFRTEFGKDPAVIARAPGRVEFAGNHLDYNGGPVLGLSINRFVTVAVAARNDARIRFASSGYPTCEVAMESIAPGMSPSWINYPVGVHKMLHEAGYIADGQGFDFAVSSDLPAGAGLSSSAALEMASALAMAHLLGRVPTTLELVRLCRRAENEFVGVPCGILDQGVIGFGRQAHLVAIDCEHEQFSTVPFPANWAIWIFPSGGKHSLVDSLYAQRHSECRAALEKIKLRHPQVEVLAQVPSSVLEEMRPSLTDEENRRTRHVVEETARVYECMKVLGDVRVDGDRVGEILTASHYSSRDFFENSTLELDQWVDALQGVTGVFGARLTGGGFGGAVMALADETFSEDQAAGVVQKMYEKYGYESQATRLKTADGAERIV